MAENIMDPWANPDGLTQDQTMFVRAIMAHLFIDFGIQPSITESAPEWRFSRHLTETVKLFDRHRTETINKLLEENLRLIHLIPGRTTE